MMIVLDSRIQTGGCSVCLCRCRVDEMGVVLGSCKERGESRDSVLVKLLEG